MRASAVVTASDGFRASSASESGETAASSKSLAARGVHRVWDGDGIEIYLVGVLNSFIHSTRLGDHAHAPTIARARGTNTDCRTSAPGSTQWPTLTVSLPSSTLNMGLLLRHLFSQMDRVRRRWAALWRLLGRRLHPRRRPTLHPLAIPLVQIFMVQVHRPLLVPSHAGVVSVESVLRRGGEILRRAVSSRRCLG